MHLSFVKFVGGAFIKGQLRPASSQPNWVLTRPRAARRQNVMHFNMFFQLSQICQITHLVHDGLEKSMRA